MNRLGAIVLCVGLAMGAQAARGGTNLVPLRQYD